MYSHYNLYKCSTTTTIIIKTYSISFAILPSEIRHFVQPGITILLIVVLIAILLIVVLIAVLLIVVLIAILLIYNT